MKRELVLDNVLERFPDVIVLEDTEQIQNLFLDYFHLENLPELVLNIKKLPTVHLSSLLKFVEEYEGDIILIAKDDPIPTPILSRFSIIKKEPEINEKINNIEYLNILKNGRYLNKSIKLKILQFLDLDIKEEKELDEYDYDDDFEDNF